MNRISIPENAVKQELVTLLDYEIISIFLKHHIYIYIYIFIYIIKDTGQKHRESNMIKEKERRRQKHGNIHISPYMYIH